MALTPEVVVQFLSAILQLVLAGLLLSLRFFNVANRALALLLVLRGLFHAMEALYDLFAATQPWLYASAHYFLAYLIAIGYFVGVYPHRRRWLPPSPWTAAPFLTLMALGSLLLASRAWPGPDGFPVWFNPTVGLAQGLFGLLALVLLRDALRTPPGPQRSSVLLVGVAFTLIMLYDMLSMALVPGSDVRATPWDWLTASINLPLYGILAAWLWRARRRTGDPQLRQSLQRYLIAMTVAALSAVVVFLLATVAPGLPAASWVAYVWDFALPILLAYALLRHQLFGIDLKIRWTIKQSTLAAVFVGVFFVASEMAQQVFSEDLALGPYLGIAAAGALVFVLAPLQRMADRVADVAMPGARNTAEYRTVRKREVYRAAVESAFEDGSITGRERRTLAILATELGLTPSEALDLERAATRGVA